MEPKTTNGYSANDVMQNKELFNKVLNFFSFVHKKCVEDKEYDINLVDALKKQCGLSSKAARDLVATGVGFCFYRTPGKNNRYLRFFTDKNVPTEAWLTMLFKKIHYSSASATGRVRKIHKAPEVIHVVAPNEKVIEDFQNTEIFNQLKKAGYNITLEKPVKYIF